MNIEFKKIQIENFLSIGKAEVTLDTNGFVRVVGVNKNSQDLALSNGAGKSSIFDAIAWALTGETIRGLTNNVVNKNTSGGTLVSLYFDCDGSSYNVIRTRDHSVFKSNMFLRVNGVDKSGKGLRETEKILNDYLPDISMGLIGSVIVLGQGLPQRFTNNTPSGRKEVLEKLSKSDFMIDDLKTRITARREELYTKQRECEDSSLKIGTEIRLLEQTNTSKNSDLVCLNNRDELVKEKEEIEKELESFVKQKGELSKSVEDMEKRLTDLRVEYASLDSDMLQEEVKETSSLVENIPPMNDEMSILNAQISIDAKEVDRIHNTKDICPTCGQKIIGIDKLRESANEIESRIERSRRRVLELRKSVSDIQNTIDEKKKVIMSRYETSRKSIVDEGNRLKSDIVKKKSELNIFDREIEEDKASLAETLNSINNFDNLRKSLTEEIERNKLQIAEKQEKLGYIKVEEEDISKRLSFVNKLWTCVTRDFRGYLLKNVIEYMSKMAKYFSSVMFDGSYVDICLDGNAVSISYDGREYESLSGGEKQKVDIIVQFAIRDMLCKFLNFECNILVVDEVFDNLDEVGCGNVLNLINGLNNISCIYVITHHGSELSIPYDSEIIVTKGSNGVSEVEQR